MNNRDLLYLAAARFADHHGMAMEDAIKKAIDLMYELDSAVKMEYGEWDGNHHTGIDLEGPLCV